MSTANLNKVASFLESQGITPTKEMVISLSIKTLVDAGIDFRTAFELVLGEGSFEKVARSIYSQLLA